MIPIPMNARVWLGEGCARHRSEEPPVLRHWFNPNGGGERSDGHAQGLCQSGRSG